MPTVANSNLRQTNGGCEQHHREDGDQTIHYEPAFHWDFSLDSSSSLVAITPEQAKGKAVDKRLDLGSGSG
jgi:hypothetical protein